MKLKKILCIGALMALPMSMSAGDSMHNIKDYWVYTLGQIINKQSCAYRYLFKNESLSSAIDKDPSKIVTIVDESNEMYEGQEIQGFYYENTDDISYIEFTYPNPCDKTSDIHQDSKNEFQDRMNEAGINIDFNKAYVIVAEVKKHTIKASKQPDE